MALGCQDQHGKPFFHLCCHPLLVGSVAAPLLSPLDVILQANQTLETARPAQCIPHQDPVPTSPAYATPKPDPTPTTSPAYVTPKPDPTPAPSPSPSPSPNTGGGAVQVNVGGVYVEIIPFHLSVLTFGSLVLHTSIRMASLALAAPYTVTRTWLLP